MKLQEITPLILTYNEDPNIARVLGKLDWAEHVVIVDSGSSDRTVDIASAFPQVQVFVRPFDNHVDQWNFGLDQISTPWVLTMDADYVLTDHFVAELTRRAPLLDCDGYFARFRYCINGRLLRGSLYPPRLLLFKTGRGRYVADGHTQRLELEGRTGWFSSRIHHDDRKPLADWLRAQERYSQLEALKLRTEPVNSLDSTDRLRRHAWLIPLLTPAYCLFRKGLILDGRAGFYYTFQRTYTELLMALRLLEADGRAALARNEHKHGALVRPTEPVTGSTGTARTE
ncbi:MAG TPA: glycosyltransferase family 2 protein [Acidobacteriaceae bacterium]|nr:glycosyltransferase family 2 protein [Acidobacteriaceae bacterium]